MGLIVKGLLVAGIIEFALIRTFSRMGIFLPAREPIMSIFNLMMFIGSVSFNFASLLVIFALTLSSYYLLKHPPVSERAIGTLIIPVVALSLLFLAITPSLISSIIYNMLSLALILMLGFTLAEQGRKVENFFGVLVALSFASTYLFKTLPLIDQVLGSSMNSSGVTVLNLGEALAVAATPLIFFIAYRSKRGSGETLYTGNTMAIITATAVAGLFASFYLANPWIASIMAVWTLGFTLYLPFPFYPVAIWLFFYSIVSLPKDRKGLAYGLLLILLAGHLMQLTYLNLLAILGMVLASKPELLEARG